MQTLPRKITFALSSIIIILVILGIVAVTGQKDAFGQATVLFNLDHEISIPNWVSTILLFILALVTFFIAITETVSKNRFASHWQWLSFIFLLMSIEEVASIRDGLITIPLRDLFNLTGIFYYGWVIPIGILTLIFVFAYARFIRSLPSNIRLFFIIGIFTYIFGAIGLELVGGWIVTGDSFSAIYTPLTVIEETLELIGIIVILHSLLTYIVRDSWEMVTIEDIKNSDIHLKSFFPLIRGVAIVIIIVTALVAYLAISEREYVSLTTLQMWGSLPMEAPPNQEPIVFGDDILPLWGSSYSYQEEWNLIDVNLWWWTQTAPERNYSIGVYLLNSSGEVVAQTDGAINDVYYETVETSRMEANRIYIDQRIIDIPETIPAGEYALYMAVYQWWDGVKLELADGGDLLHIGDVVIP